MVSIGNAMDELGGYIFPKLDWSSPSDAKWITCEKNLKCTCIGDLLLLLKSSDKITKQLTEPYIHCTNNKTLNKQNYTLILRSWSNLLPSGEFRCFIRSGQIIAVCQRDPNFYEHLLDIETQEVYKEAIEAFWEDKIKSKFLLQNYIMDVYIDRDERVWLIGMKPFATCTDSILYTWSEILSLPIPSTIPTMDEDGPPFDFRVIESTSQECYAPRTANEIVQRLPHDGIDVSDANSIQSLIDRIQYGDLKTQNDTEE
jgi:hypothetical protein